MSYDSNIYPEIPSAPPDTFTFNKQRAQTFLANLDQLENDIAQKCSKVQTIVNRLNNSAAACSVLSVIASGSTIATAVSVVGVPVSAGLGTISVAASAASFVTSKFEKAKTKKLKVYTALLDEIHSARASFEYAFSKSLNGGISTDEFGKLQKIYTDLLKKMKRKYTASFMEELKQADFLAQVANIVTKKG